VKAENCLEVSIDLGKGFSDTIKVFPGNNIENLVNTFCLKHNLVTKVKESLVKHIEEKFTDSVSLENRASEIGDIDDACIPPEEVPGARAAVNKSNNGHLDKHKVYQDLVKDQCNKQEERKISTKVETSNNPNQVKTNRPLEVSALKNEKGQGRMNSNKEKG